MTWETSISPQAPRPEFAHGILLKNITRISSQGWLVQKLGGRPAYLNSIQFRFSEVQLLISMYFH